MNHEDIITRLEEAGAALLRLPASGFTTRLRQMRLYMPDMDVDAFTASGGRQRYAAPSPAQIDAMDEAFAWLAHIPDSKHVLRRIVGARAMVHPITLRHLYPWRRLGTVFGADHKSVQRWHQDGINLIARALRGKTPFQPGAEIMKFFTDTVVKRAQDMAAKGNTQDLLAYLVTEAECVIDFRLQQAARNGITAPPKPLPAMSREQLLLIKNAEEAMEYGIRALKAAQFGLEEIQTEQTLTNRQRLASEYLDLSAVFGMLEEETGAVVIDDIQGLTAKRIQKRARVDRFAAYSKTLNRVA